MQSANSFALNRFRTLSPKHTGGHASAQISFFDFRISSSPISGQPSASASLWTIGWQMLAVSCRLFPKEFFDGREFGFRHVEILFGGFGVLFLHGGLRFGDVRLHALLGGD